MSAVGKQLDDWFGRFWMLGRVLVWFFPGGLWRAPEPTAPGASPCGGVVLSIPDPAPAPAKPPAPSAPPVPVVMDEHCTSRRRMRPRAPTARTREPTRNPELTDFQLMVQSSLGQVLPIYGASLFENVPSTFAPVDHIPVTADYVIGPGDELMIRAWGQIDLDVHARVDRNGNVFLPKVGKPECLRL